MIDLHTHTTFSDGVLIPAELVRRARVAGYKAVAITDHADLSTMKHTLECVLPLARQYAAFADMEIIAGVEITHVPAALIPDTVSLARDLGAQLVVVHGETPVEPVEIGTNHAAIAGGADILAHPGLLTPQDADFAAERGVHVEITTRKGHSLTNGHVAALHRKHGFRIVINNDAHGPGDFIGEELRRTVGLGAGLTKEEYRTAEDNSRAIVNRIIASR